MGDSGALKSLHEGCQAITEAAESQYIAVKDKLENIVDSLNAQEEQLVAELIEDYADVRTGLIKYSELG